MRSLMMVVINKKYVKKKWRTNRERMSKKFENGNSLMRDEMATNDAGVERSRKINYISKVEIELRVERLFLPSANIYTLIYVYNI